MPARLTRSMSGNGPFAVFIAIGIVTTTVLPIMFKNTLSSPTVPPKSVQLLRLNVVALVQLLKQLFPIVVHNTILKVVADVQLRKQLSSANVSDGKLNVITDVQLEKQLLPAELSNGNITLVADVSDLKT